MIAGYEYFDEIEKLIRNIKENNKKVFERAGDLVADTVINGGIVQAYGGGHSYGSAMEIVERAGGLIPAKLIKDPAMGLYEKTEGAAYYLTKRLRIDSEDVVFIISNSGRNPFQIDLANYVKESGAQLIVIGSETASKNLTSKHSSGNLLKDYADIFVDNHVVLGDSAVKINGLDEKVGPISSVAVAVILNVIMINAYTKMLQKNVTPPIYLSGNLDDSEEHNVKLLEKYRNRVFNY